jgi:IS605 OrfB family transposase
MNMGTKAYFSNRIYKSVLPEEYVSAIGHALLVFNRAKHFAFSTVVKEKRSGTSQREASLHLTVKKRFSLDDYYTNSAVQEANAKQKSLSELNTLYQSNTDAQIQSVKRKMKTEKAKLTKLKKIKQSFVKGKPSFPHNGKEQQHGTLFAVHGKKKTDLYYHAYAFEHGYVDVHIKRLQTKLGFLAGKLHRLEDKQKYLRTEVASVVFGSKKRFKSQYTIERYQQRHRLWVKEWENARYRKIIISGRKDSAQGNFVFRYDCETHTLRFHTPSGVFVEVKDLLFPYGQQQVESAVLAQQKCKDKKKYGKPIAWAVEDHGDYYIFKCMAEVERNLYVNYSKADGMIGIDCNVDHFAISHINSKGQRVDSWTLPFDLKGKSSGQITKIIEAEAIELVRIAQEKNKPIAIEKLNTTTSKVSHHYGNKKANRLLSLFAYNKMISAIYSRAEKMGVAVFSVNPAYTSVIGKMKYMKRFGISIHEAASFVIARRAMGYKETLPPMLGELVPEKIRGAHHWAQWKVVSSYLKGIRTHAFYRSELFAVRKFYCASELFSPRALTDEEAKGLRKVCSRKSTF